MPRWLAVASIVFEIGVLLLFALAVCSCGNGAADGDEEQEAEILPDGDLDLDLDPEEAPCTLAHCPVGPVCVSPTYLVTVTEEHDVCEEQQCRGERRYCLDGCVDLPVPHCEVDGDRDSIEWECAENDSGGKWTFCPVDTGRSCDVTGSGILYAKDAYYTPWENATANDDWVLFIGNATGTENQSQVYGCYLPNGSLYQILAVDGYYDIINKLILDGNILAASYFSASHTESYIVGDMSTWDTRELGMHGYWELTGLDYPYVFAYEYEQPLHVYNLPDDSHVVLDSVRCGFETNLKYFKGNVVFEGRPESNHDAYSVGLWEIDLTTKNLVPISVNGRYEGVGGAMADKDYILYFSTNDMIRTDFWETRGTAAYLFDRKNRREITLTDNPDRNENGLLLDYPYIGWFFWSSQYAPAGPTEIYHYETWERWHFADVWGDTGYLDRTELRNRKLTNITANRLSMYTLPSAGTIPDGYDCDDRNPCTDDLWWVSVGGCHRRNNHDRCDDKNAATPFDVCVAGRCVGLALGSDDGPMAEIPAGTFLWGSDPVPESASNPGRVWEGPQRQHSLPAFFIDVYEVTNAQYRRCVEAGACAMPKRTRSGRIKQYYGVAQYDGWPVLYVDWYEARNYCEWAGKRLPTEAEWSKAARGSEDGRLYPWGNDPPSSGNPKANIMLDPFANIDVTAGGAFAGDVSPYGVHDLTGNVSEWTASAWTPDSLDGEATWGSDLMVIKGSNVTDSVHDAVAFRRAVTPWTASFFVGFRCVKDVEP